MSRSHMIYNDTTINKVFNIKWREHFHEDAVLRFQRGRGVTIEGIVKNKCRVAITDLTSGKTIQNYAVISIEFMRAYKRSFDGNGVEVEPWKSATKKVNTGHLLSSYKTVEIETSGISFQDLSTLINVPEFNCHLPKLEPRIVRLFCNESRLGNIEVNVGENFRMKTKGNGPYVEYIARLDKGHISASEHEGQDQASWTDKIMSMQSQNEKAFTQAEGVDDSEWDD